MSDANTLQAAVKRLMALPTWYEQACPGPHPYADPKRPKQDSHDLMTRVGADIRMVCGAVADAREDTERLDFVDSHSRFTGSPNGNFFIGFYSTRTGNIREAIDAVRKGGGNG